MSTSTSAMISYEPVTLWRRLGAMIYDCFAVFAVCYAAGAIAVGLNRGHEIDSHAWWFTLYLLFAIYVYFAYCWRLGQTLGMRSWKIRIVDSATSGPVSWRQIATRFCMAMVSFAAGGVGVLSAIWDPQSLTWHDKVSGTKLIKVPPSNQPP